MNEQETECRKVVYEYASAINDWEIRYYIWSRIEDGMFVSEKRRHLVEGQNRAVLLAQHRQIFDKYVTKRDRKYGSNPGKPNSWSRDGSFFDIDPNTITNVERSSKNTVRVTTKWGRGLVPGGATMFVLKFVDGTWKIDSLKTLERNGWEIDHI